MQSVFYKLLNVLTNINVSAQNTYSRHVHVHVQAVILCEVRGAASPGNINFVTWLLAICTQKRTCNTSYEKQ